MNISNISEIKNISNNLEELKINNIEDIKKNFEIIKTTGNGNSIFESLISCMNDNKIFINFKSNKLKYIINLREHLANYLLSGNCSSVITNLYCCNINPENFANKIRKNYNWGGNYEISIFSLLYNCQINVICHEQEEDKININKIGNGNFCIWLYYEYNKNYENINEHYKCLIPLNKENIGDYETYKQMKNKIINDLDIIIDLNISKNIIVKKKNVLNDKNINKEIKLENLIEEIEQKDNNKLSNDNEKNDLSSEKEVISNQINNIKNLKKKYSINRVTGDGNCLFYSLSNLIFREMIYYSHIRQLICDKIENTNKYDEVIKNKNDYIRKMRTDNEYGSLLEIKIFSEIFEIKITIYIRHIDDEQLLKKDSDLLETQIIGEKYEGNFGIILDKYKKTEKETLNHFMDIYPKDGKIGISDEKLKNIQNNIKNKYPNSKIDNIISGKTGKKVGPRQGKSDWKMYDILTRMNKEKNTYNHYIVVTKNNEIKNGNIANYKDLVKYTKLSDIINKFKAENIRKNGVNNIIENYYNILIDNIKIKDKVRPLSTDDFGSILNLNDDLAKEFTKCICHECSGLNE